MRLLQTQNKHSNSLNVTTKNGAEEVESYATRILANRRVLRLVAEGVVGQGENMQLRRNIHFTQLQIDRDRTGGRVAVAVAVNEAHRRRFGVEREVADERRVVSAIFVFAVDAVAQRVSRVNRNREVQVARRFIEIVDRFVSRRLARRRGHQRQVSARRKAHYADFFRVDPPLVGLRTDDSDRSLDVLPSGAVLFDARSTRRSIAQHHDRDAVFDEEIARHNAFVVVSDAVVSAAATNN